jgi:predicted NAD/FAD-binding protein
LAQLGNLAGLQLVRLFGEIVRFAMRAERQVRPDQTLAQFIDEGDYSPHFERHFLLPLTAALWSTSATATRDFPAAHVIGFMAHHGMLRLRRFTWRTIVGGSRTYVDRLVAGLPNGVRLATPVEQITRFDDRVEIRVAGVMETFDQVILACHADQALRLLSDPSPDEQRILGAIPFTTNPTVLHTDTALLPRRRGAQAAWNYRTRDCRIDEPSVTVTYDVSRLQHLPGPERYLVTLNRDKLIDPERVLARMDYSHPRYTFDMLAAQRQMPTIDGVRRTWYCGAWRGFGFHEDGLRSGHDVAVALGGGWR